MLAPVPSKTLRRVLKRLRTESRPRCEQRSLVERLVAEQDPRVHILRPSPEQRVRAEAINGLMAHCIFKCGGCRLTEGWKLVE